MEKPEKGSSRPLNLCFGRRQALIILLLYDVFMMSRLVEASSGDETSLKKRDITLL